MGRPDPGARSNRAVVGYCAGALERAGIDALYIDHGVGGTETSRLRFDAMLADLGPSDTVVIYSLSRRSHALKHPVELGAQFEAGGIGLVSLTVSIDSATTMGRFMYTMLAALAAMKRDLLRERTLAEPKSRAGQLLSIVSTDGADLPKALRRRQRGRSRPDRR